MCTSQKELKQTLSRAKNAPLNIRIDCQGWEPAIFKQPAFLQLFIHLFSPEITPRMTRLDLADDGLPLPKDFIDWSQCKFSSLRELSCSTGFPCAQPFLKTIDETATNLGVVHLTRYSPNKPLDRAWPNLKRFYFGAVNGFSLDPVLQLCQSLQLLSVQKTEWPTDSTPPIRFSQLNHATLRCFRLLYMTNLRLPRLTTLFLTQSHHYILETTAAASIAHVSTIEIDLPELTSLHLTASPAWLAAFRTPKLIRLVYSSGYAWADLDNDCLKFVHEKQASLPSPLFESLKTLVFISSASSIATVKTLSLCPNISRLRVSSSYGPPGKEFLRALEDMVSTTSDVNLSLPQLRSLEWGTAAYRIRIQEKIVTQQVHSLFQARQNMGLALDEVTVHIVTSGSPTFPIGKELRFTHESFRHFGRITYL
jgi:hypothetical protein